MSPAFSENPPSLLAISHRRGLPDGSLEKWLRGMGEAGVPAVQLREKDLSDRELYELAKTARRLLPGSTRLLINGRADIALAAGADGVHLPVLGPPVAALRKRFGAALVLGCSTHNVDEALAAHRGGADYLTFGPIFEPISKSAVGVPPGLKGLRELLEALPVSIPVFGLGGLTEDHLSLLADAGAAGAAGISLFQKENELQSLVESARKLFPGGVKEVSRRNSLRAGARDV